MTTQNREFKIIPWPNSLGYDVGEHEIWKLKDGYWGICYFKDGEPLKSLKIHPTMDELFPISKQDAIILCKHKGKDCI